MNREKITFYRRQDDPGAILVSAGASCLAAPRVPAALVAGILFLLLISSAMGQEYEHSTAGSASRGGNGAAVTPPPPIPDATRQSARASGSCRSQDEPDTDPPVSDDIRYSSFFRHMLALERAADQMKKNGQDGEHWRTHMGRAIGLTPQEAETLRQVALDWKQAMREVDQSIRTARRNANLPPGKKPDESFRSQAVQLNRQKIEITYRSIDRLRGQLGTESFQKVADHVQRCEHSQVAGAAVSASTSGSTQKPSGGVE